MRPKSIEPVKRGSKSSYILTAPDGVSIADVSTLSRVARIPHNSQVVRKRMVDRLSHVWSKGVGEILLKPPGDRSLENEDLRNAAEIFERGVSKDERDR